MVNPPVIFIVGPTASGKSELALSVAEKIGAEICSMDAFQVYRGLDIGTGKVPESGRRGITHHLLDIADPLQPFSVADYLEKAGDVRKILRPLIWVGGTGLYFRALREGLSPVPASEPALVRELSGWPLESLQKEVRKLDPDWSEKADLQNPRRIIRALAVVKQTGRPLSDWHEIRGRGLIEKSEAFFIQPETDILKERIAIRVGEMWREGWRQEVEKLLEKAGWQESQSARAIGYSQVAGCLAGRLSEEECLESIRIKTWQYARRQLTWFRSEENLRTLAPERALDQILQVIDKKTKWQL